MTDFIPSRRKQLAADKPTAENIIQPTTDWFRFVNSQDIQKHLQSIGYVFSPLEAAWLIWQNEQSTIWDKHQAWKTLIATMPDCPIERRLKTEAQPSLHAYLQQYINAEQRLLDRFFLPEADACYIYEIIYSGGQDYMHYSDRTVYTSLDPLVQDITNQEESAQEYICNIHIAKCSMNHSAWRIEVSIQALCDLRKPNYGIKEIRAKGILQNEQAILESCFFGMWFGFPTPFRKGDLVINLWDRQCGWENVCLLDSISSAENRSEGDPCNLCENDMKYTGYSISESGVLVYRSEINYMNIEHFHGKLNGNQRLLPLLRRYLSEKIGIEAYTMGVQRITCLKKSGYDGFDLEPVQNFL